ncbi:MAG: T9SS type A sorting domain-containing protein, partial [Cytophagales bacterium]|nr:T9SS type A sorting domain-containing protein [Cytophagales bacterium]
SLHYALDGFGPADQAPEQIRGFNGQIAGSVSYVDDRLGNYNSAVSFDAADAHIALPSIFDSINYYQGYTISFWLRNDEVLSSPTSGVALPFSSHDVPRKIFYGENGSGQNLVGMQLRHDRLGTLRYAKKNAHEIVPWYFWFYDPISFNARPTGWYHVILVQGKYETRAYLAAQHQVLNCECDSQDEYCLQVKCPVYYSYLGVQDLSAVNHWVLGNSNGDAVAALDDFKVYDWPLSTREVRALHGVIFDIGPEREELDEPSWQREAPSSTRVYPNPTHGAVWLSLPSEKEQTVSVTIRNMQGGLLLEKTFPLQSGTNTLLLDEWANSHAKSGLYMLQADINGVSHMLKVALVK